MAQVKEIIVPAEAITKDAALEQHIYECIISADFNTLKTEQQAVTDVVNRIKAQRDSLHKTYERMKAANNTMRQAEGQSLIFSKDDFTYIEEQFDIVSQNLAYYDARINVIDEVLQSADDAE